MLASGCIGVHAAPLRLHVLWQVAEISQVTDPVEALSHRRARPVRLEVFEPQARAARDTERRCLGGGVPGNSERSRLRDVDPRGFQLCPCKFLDRLGRGEVVHRGLQFNMGL